MLCLLKMGICSSSGTNKVTATGNVYLTYHSVMAEGFRDKKTLQGIVEKAAKASKAN